MIRGMTLVTTALVALVVSATPARPASATPGAAGPPIAAERDTRGPHDTHGPRESAAVISELTAGVHELSLTKNGYVPLKARLNYEAGHRTVIDLSSADVQAAPAARPPA